MKNSDLIKVAGFISSLKESLSKDNPERGRMVHAGLGGAAGAGLGGWMGYNHALNQSLNQMVDLPPNSTERLWRNIGLKPDITDELFGTAPKTLVGKAKEFGRYHKQFLPVIAKYRASKLAIPALLAGGAGAALGAMIPGKTRTPRDRAQELWRKHPGFFH